MSIKRLGELGRDNAIRGEKPAGSSNRRRKEW
jgi:hypothetical protein